MRPLALAFLLTATACALSSPRVDGRATVLSVVDGDTIVVEIVGRTETLRLIGVDTPESVHPERPVECFGPEAAEFLSTLLPPHTEVTIQRDVVGRDHYGRLLGYVRRASDGLYVNDELVRQGFARPMSIEPNTSQRESFVEAARAAEAADVGLWAACR